MNLVIKFILVCALLPSLTRLARADYYPYQKGSSHVSAESFDRYVLPQLNAISKEFYHILVKLNPLHKNLIKLNEQGKGLVKKIDSFEKECMTMKGQCSERLKSIYKLSREMDHTILSIQEYKVTLKGSHYIRMISQLDQISNNNYKVMHYLEEYRLTSNTSYSSYFKKKHVITQLIHEILINTKMIMTGFLAKEVQKDFEAVWFQFITPIEENIIEPQNKKFLLQRLSDLNMTWNTFHMKMTKGNFKMPRNITKTIKVMHNRWNSILKIVLR